jgi:hypothetical protein
MEVYLFTTYVVQVKYVNVHSQGRSSTYQDGSSEGILLLCVSSSGGDLGRLGIFLLVSTFKIVTTKGSKWAGCYEIVWRQMGMF